MKWNVPDLNLLLFGAVTFSGLVFKSCTSAEVMQKCVGRLTERWRRPTSSWQPAWNTAPAARFNNQFRSQNNLLTHNNFSFLPIFLYLLLPFSSKQIPFLFFFLLSKHWYKSPLSLNDKKLSLWQIDETISDWRSVLLLWLFVSLLKHILKVL